MFSSAKWCVAGIRFRCVKINSRVPLCERIDARSPTCTCQLVSGFSSFDLALVLISLLHEMSAMDVQQLNSFGAEKEMLREGDGRVNSFDAISKWTVPFYG